MRPSRKRIVQRRKFYDLFRSGGRIEALSANQLCVTVNLVANVRFGSEADIQRCLGDVRFTPKADIVERDRHVRFVPKQTLA